MKKKTNKRQELLFSLSKKDFELQFFRAGGKGGQHQNKTSSACRVIHPESGGVGECREERSQYANKKKAFIRCTEHPKFKTWINRKAYFTIREIDIEKIIEDSMSEDNLKIEILNEKGEWCEA